MRAPKVASAAGRSAPADAWERALALRETVIDGRNAVVSFSVRWLGLFLVRGRFEDVRGVIRVPDGDASRAEVHVVVGATSVRTGIAPCDRLLRADAFLAVSRHPTIHFRSAEVTPKRPRLAVRALVTARGVTAVGRLDCQVSSPDGRALLLVGTGVLSRRAFAVGCPEGLARLNPMYWLLADRVAVRVQVRVEPGA